MLHKTLIPVLAALSLPLVGNAEPMIHIENLEDDPVPAELVEVESGRFEYTTPDGEVLEVVPVAIEPTGNGTANVTPLERRLGFPDAAFSGNLSFDTILRGSIGVGVIIGRKSDIPISAGIFGDHGGGGSVSTIRGVLVQIEKGFAGERVSVGYGVALVNRMFVDPIFGFAGKISAVRRNDGTTYAGAEMQASFLYGRLTYGVMKRIGMGDLPSSNWLLSLGLGIGF